jgi:DNA-binding transcriptional LysR family regulator
MDRLVALRILIRVSETGSFSRVATESGVSQSAVSRAITALEADLGARLLNRTTRRVALTEAGQRACDRARLVISEMDGLEASVRGLGQEPVGLLRVASSVAFARAELAPVAGEFLKAWPRVRLDLAARDDRVDLIAEGVDLAFRLGDQQDSRLTGRQLGSYRRMVVASSDFEDRHGRVSSPRDLPDFPCLGFTSTAYGNRWPLSNGRERLDVEVMPTLRTANGEVIADLMRSGLGAALVPSFLVSSDIDSGRLVRLLPEWSAPPLALWALWQGRALSGKARAFLDFIIPRLAISS